MNTLRSNGNGLTRLRRVHRWVGATLLLFVVFLSVSGIAVNHASDFGLDRKYISWSWLLEAYGMKAPSPYAGMVSLEQLVVVGDGQRVHLLLETGELIESIDLGVSLPGDIVRVGSAGDRAILDSGGILYRSDKEITLFEPWAAGTEHDEPRRLRRSRASGAGPARRAGRGGTLVRGLGRARLHGKAGDARRLLRAAGIPGFSLDPQARSRTMTSEEPVAAPPFDSLRPTG